MNKKAEQDIFLQIIGGIFGLIIIIAFLNYMNNLSCSNEKSQIESLTNDNKNCWAVVQSLNQTVQNCSNLINEQKDICDDRIKNEVVNLTIQNEKYYDYIISSKFFFAVYHILIIFFYIPLTINLFKITFKVKLKKKWEESIFWYNKVWLIAKIFFWVVLSLFIIIYIISFLTTNPLNL